MYVYGFVYMCLMDMPVCTEPTLDTSGASEGGEGGNTSMEVGGEGQAEGEGDAPVVKKNKKTVRWAEESNLRQFFYFEMDENERG